MPNFDNVVNKPDSPIKGVKPNPRPSTKKNVLFHHLTPERTLDEILNIDDVRKLTYDETQKLQKYVNKRQRDIAKRQAENPDFESSKKSFKPTKSRNAQKLFHELMRQQQYYNDYETDKDLKDNAKDYDNLDSLLKDEDKWTILRRLATQDVMLNIDRAYASKTLKEIERMIDSGVYKDIDEITADLMKKYKSKKKEDREWDAEMKTFTDFALSENKGFHGVEKARAKRKSKMDGFEPMWEKPLKYATEEELDKFFPF